MGIGISRFWAPISPLRSWSGPPAAAICKLKSTAACPAPLLVKYFQRAGLGWLVKGEVRKFVRFTQFDLRNGMRSLGVSTWYFGRNVLIYFDLETRKKILGGIRGALQPGGVLPDGFERNYFQPGRQLVRSTVRSHHRVSDPHATGNQMTAHPAKRKLPPGDSQITRGRFPRCWTSPLSPMHLGAGE